MQPEENINPNISAKKVEINPFVIGGVIFAVVAIILLIISLISLLKTNDLGPVTRIDNFTSVYDNLSQDDQNMIFGNLYGMIAKNVPEGVEIPESGALIREGTAEYDYDESTRVYYGNFVVDIPSIEQSYRVQFEWSPVDNNRNLGGYPVVITCLPKNLRIYEETFCNNFVEIDATWTNAFQLDYTFGSGTSWATRKAIGNYLINELDGEDGYTIVIDESTLRRDKNIPDIAYLFSITLNDSYTFDVVVRTDELYGKEYIAVYLVGDNDIKHGFVMTDSEEEKESLNTWLKDYSDDAELNIDNIKLSEAEDN